MEDRIQIIVIATGFAENVRPEPSTRTGSASAARPASSVATPREPRSSGTPAPGRVRLELEESEVRTAGSGAEEDLFRISGVPTNQLDVPAFVRRRRSS